MEQNTENAYDLIHNKTKQEVEDLTKLIQAELGKGFDTSEAKKLLEQWTQKKQEIEEIKEQKKKAEEKLQDVELKIVDMLLKAGLNSFNVPSVGTFSIKKYFSVTTPKTEAEKKELFKWLQSQGSDIFWTNVSVHSGKLNTLYKNFKAESEARGDREFELPGCGKSKLSTIKLGLRKETKK